VTLEKSIALRSQAQSCRRLAQEADHLDAIRELLRKADECDLKADRLAHEGGAVD
jgi:hypothetical protein